MVQPVSSSGRRPTSADVARLAGVSTGAVSYALNGKGGVSAETRQRILEAAEQLGWRPNEAARALSFSRAGAVGFIIARPPQTLGDESFYMQLITGMEAELSKSSTALLLQTVETVEESVEAYRRWAAQGRVDGVIVTDVRREDPRPAALRALRLPAVVLGGDAHTGLPRVWSDDETSVRDVVTYLAGLGHERIGYVTGSPAYLHTLRRTRVYTEVLATLGLAPVVEVTDFSVDSGRDATRRLLASANPPTALVYDSDAMAVAGLGVATAAGVSVPADLSIVAWDDSLVCQVVHPALTAISRDIRALGGMAAAHLSAVLRSAARGGGVPTPALADDALPDVVEPAPQLVVRASTGPPPAAVRAPARARRRGRGGGGDGRVSAERPGPAG